MKLKTFRERFEWIKEKKNLNNESISKWFGITSQGVQKWSANNKIPPRNIDLLCKKLGVNRTWLIEGLGDIWDLSLQVEENYPTNRAKVALRFHQEIVRLEMSIANVSEILEIASREVELLVLGYKEISAVNLINLANNNFDVNYILMGDIASSNAKPGLTINNQDNSIHQDNSIKNDVSNNQGPVNIKN